MALENTSIQSGDSAALYIIHNGLSVETDSLTRLASGVATAAKKPTYVLDKHTEDARRIIDFYDLLPSQLPVAMIIGSDDQVVHQWQGTTMPSTPDEIAFLLNQIS